MGLLFGVEGMLLKMAKRKQTHSAYFSFNFLIKKSYLQTGKCGTNKVKKEQTLKIDEEIVREYLASSNDLKFGERPDNTFQSMKGTEEITLDCC